jgi:hypothetical protein
MRHIPVGWQRVYAKAEVPFSYANWIQAVRQGKTFVTSGPMLALTANGREIGDTIAIKTGEQVTVRAEVHSRLPVQRLEIVRGGEVVATQENAGKRRDFALETALTVTGSDWIAARAVADRRLPYQEVAAFGLVAVPLFAQTSPVYLEVRGTARLGTPRPKGGRGWESDEVPVGPTIAATIQAVRPANAYAGARPRAGLVRRERCPCDRSS